MNKKKRHNFKKVPQQKTKKDVPRFTVGKDSFRLKVFLILFFIGVGVYFNSFGNDFVWDDLMIITPSEYIRDWKYVKEIFLTNAHHFARQQSNFYRPIQVLTYAFDYTFWQLNPVGYHLSNTFIHIINAFLVYILMFSVINHLRSIKENQTRYLALSTALLWLVHPIHAQCTTYISGRADLLVGTFILLTAYTYLNHRGKVFSVGFYILALLSKELGMITPLFLILLDYFIRPKENNIFKRYGPYVIVLVVYIGLRLTVLNFPDGLSFEKIPEIGSRLLTSARAIMILLGLIVFPFSLNMTRNIPWETTLLDLKVLTSILGVLLMVFCIFKFKKKYPIIAFGFLWFFIGYLPVLNVFPMNANVSEHWMYLPSIGIFFSGVYILFTLVKYRINVFIIIILSLSIYFGALLVKRNFDFKNEITLYNQILSIDSDNARAHYNLGTAYVRIDDYEKALIHLRRATELKTDYAGAYGNMGQIFFRQGEADKAIQYYEKANFYADNLVENHANLARAYGETGQYDKAVVELQKALKLNPKHIGALNGLGVEHGRKGEFETAEQLFLRVLEFDPENSAAQKNLKRVYSLQGSK